MIKKISFLCLLALGSSLSAQTPTRIVDTIRTGPFATLANCSLTISGPVVPANAPDSSSVTPSTFTYKVVNGVVNLSLIPNDTLVPAGTYYSVVRSCGSLPGGSPAREIWTVPTSSSAKKISDVMGTVAPPVNWVAGGDLTGTYPNPTLVTSGATAGTYGSSSLIPVITVDAKGRITVINTASAATGVSSVFGRAGAVVATGADYSAYYASLTGSYANPSWIASLSASKVGLGNVENTALSTWAGSTNITTLGTIATGTVPWARLSGVPSTFTPSLHASTHASAGSDPVSLDASQTGTGIFAIGRIPTGQTGSTVPLGNDSRFTDARTPLAHASSHLSNGSDPIGAASSSVRGTVTTTTSTSQVASTDDSRLTDSRTPLSHHISHQDGGSDEVATTTPGAAAIPKAGGTGKLGTGWIPLIQLNSILGGQPTMITGNLPIVNLNSGTAASSMTFWRGDGVWATPAGSGNVSGPGSTTNGYVPTWNGTSGTILNAGFPVSQSSGLNVIPLGGSGGALASGWIPAPTASTLGGVESIGPVSHQWINSITANNGIPTTSQPAFSDISGVATNSQLPGTLTAGTSGNAGTATGSQNVPTICSSGSFARGIDSSFNSSGCTVASVGTVTSVTYSSTDFAVSGSPVTGAGTITANLNAVNSSYGACGDADHICTITTNAKGLVLSQNAVVVGTSTNIRSGTTLPGTCAVGELYFKSDATAGQNIYECTSTNTWTQQLNSGSVAGCTSDGSNGLACTGIMTADHFVSTNTGALSIEGLSGTDPCGSVLGSHDCVFFNSANGEHLSRKNNAGIVKDLENGSTRAFGFMLGSETGAALLNTDDQPGIWSNQLGFGVHITKVWCQTDTGTSTINLQRDDGTPANILSSNLVCSTGAGASGTAFTSGEDAITDGFRVDLVVVTAATSGTPHRITVMARYTVD